MNKILLIVILILTNYSITSQELFSEIETSIEKPSSGETMSVIDNENNIYLFFISSNKIHYIKQSSEGKKLFEDTYENSEEFIFEKPIGHTISSKNKIILFFSNTWNNKFRSFEISDEQKSEYVLNKFEVDAKKEKFLFYAKSQNKFFMYNYVKNSSILKQYELEENIKNITNIDLSNERFYDKENKNCKLSEVFKYNKNVPVIKYYSEEVSNTLPSSIEFASEKIKVYEDDNFHLISLNHRKTATRTIKINLIDNNKKVELSYYPIPNKEFSQNESTKSNSFIFKGMVYQFICSKKRLNLSSFEFSSKKLIREYKFNKDEDLTIMNSNTTEGISKDLTKTSQFLRKISSSQDIGLYVYQKDDKLNLTVGGTSEIKIPIASTALGGISAGGFSVTYGAYLSFKTTKSVFINCLFDKNFDHIEGEIKENIFDRIHRYEKYIKKKEELKKLRLETIFEYNNQYSHGYYDSKNQKYYLREHKF